MSIIVTYLFFVLFINTTEICSHLCWRKECSFSFPKYAYYRLHFVQFEVLFADSLVVIEALSEYLVYRRE